MYICEMIRQSNEIFCSTIRNWAITAHAFSHVNSSRSRQKIKAVPANFNLLCEGQKGQKVMETQKDLKDTDGFDWLGSQELAIDKRKFLLNGMFVQQPIPQDED